VVLAGLGGARGEIVLLYAPIFYSGGGLADVLLV
jgi:hypothetical protein